MTIVAEGIEEPGQLAHLRGLGCELGQGFLFAPPLDAEHAGQFLREQAAHRRGAVRRTPAAAFDGFDGIAEYPALRQAGG
jgi:predicted signal transduction protein with EAL and GGDEF domain